MSNNRTFINTFAVVKDRISDAESTVPVAYYQIFDQKIVDAANSTSVAYGGVSDAVMDAMVKADTIDELADAIGAPYLASTIDIHNKDIATNGKDTFFGRTAAANLGDSKLPTIDTAPFYAWTENLWLSYTPACGVTVNTDLHPLNQFDEPIEGVYCIGELMHRNVTGDHYLDGTATAANGSLGLYLGKKLAGAPAK